MAVPVADRSKALEAALGQIDRQFGKGSIMRLGDDTRPPVAVIPTGSVALDVALGVGGLPRGRVVEIYGPESSGKSTLAMHVVAEAQRMGGICAYVDAEHAMALFGQPHDVGREHMVGRHVIEVGTVGRRGRHRRPVHVHDVGGEAGLDLQLAAGRGGGVARVGDFAGGEEPRTGALGVPTQHAVHAGDLDYVHADSNDHRLRVARGLREG